MSESELEERLEALARATIAVVGTREPMTWIELPFPSPALLEALGRLDGAQRREHSDERYDYHVVEVDRTVDGQRVRFTSQITTPAAAVAS